MTKMTQGPWTRIRPLQIDDVDAKTAAAIKTGELTRGGSDVVAPECPFVIGPRVRPSAATARLSA